MAYTISSIRLFVFYITLFIIPFANTYSSTYVLPSAGDIIGEVQFASSHVGESIDEAGRRFDVGYYEMVRANPAVDPIHSLPTNTRLIIPSQFILPDVPRKGIVINLAEYRLYYFPEDENVVFTYPVGIGKKGWNTPLGSTRISSKVTNPVWRPTANVRAAAEEIGAPLPEVFPAGVDNPLGKHALRLGWPTILIHGTNRADGVGARVSAGCIRMLPGDIEDLYQLVSTGTPVRVINQPVKLGMQDGVRYIQMHPLLNDQKKLSLKSYLDTEFRKNNLGHLSNKQIIQKELLSPSGLVKQIS
jgi:L,D-transpeptidase ErfK/SrfK